MAVAISYSGGASSRWLVEALVRGVIPRPEHVAVVTADTGGEHWWTYDEFRSVRSVCSKHGIPMLEPSPGDLAGDLLAIASENPPSRVDNPPFYIAKGDGRGRAQHRCTRQYKIAPMRRAVSAWLASKGLPKRVVKWVGFSSDEVHRAQKSLAGQDVAWERLDFPLIRLGITRAEARRQLVEWIGYAPKFSMCVFCPMKTPRRWFQTEGEDLERAIAVDEAIRDADCIGLTEGPAYLCDRLIPVRALVENGDPQPNLPGLESYCDGGACFL